MALSGRPSPLAIPVGEQTPNTVYNTYVLKTCNRTNQQINSYNTAYAVVKMLLYGDLRINKYSYSYSCFFFQSYKFLLEKGGLER